MVLLAVKVVLLALNSTDPTIDIIIDFIVHMKTNQNNFSVRDSGWSQHWCGRIPRRVLQRRTWRRDEEYFNPSSCDSTAFSNAEMMKPPVRIHQKMLAELSTDLALKRNAKMDRFSFPLAFPGLNQPPPAVPFFAAASSMLPAALAKAEGITAEDSAKDDNSELNIPLTVKRTLSFPKVPTGTRQKLGDVSVHSVERPLWQGWRNAAPVPHPIGKTQEDDAKQRKRQKSW
jgi:hypothetical protein